MPQKVRLTYKPAPAPERRKVKVTYRPRNRDYTPTPRSIERQRAREEDLKLYKRVLDLFLEDTPPLVLQSYEQNPTACEQAFNDLLDSGRFTEEVKKRVRSVM